LLTPLRRACSTTACLRAEIAALKAQLTSLGSVPVAPKPGEQSFFAGAASEYTTELKFFQPHIDGALKPLTLTPTPTLGREPRAHRLRTDTPPTLPCFRLINDMGEVCPGAELPIIDKETAMAMQVTRPPLPASISLTKRTQPA
tara:strand:- start:536 stop:967 length:432 start_codon:yes stop_codon:yes gene_type:complete